MQSAVPYVRGRADKYKDHGEWLTTMDAGEVVLMLRIRFSQ
jgi:hypothetical protein